MVYLYGRENKVFYRADKGKKQKGELAMQFIIVKSVKEYAKARKRRTSREFLLMLDAKIQQIMDSYIKMNGKTTLRP